MPCHGRLRLPPQSGVKGGKYYDYDAGENQSYESRGPGDTTRACGAPAAPGFGFGNYAAVASHADPDNGRRPSSCSTIYRGQTEPERTRTIAVCCTSILAKCCGRPSGIRQVDSGKKGATATRSTFRCGARGGGAGALGLTV